MRALTVRYRSNLFSHLKCLVEATELAWSIQTGILLCVMIQCSKGLSKELTLVLSDTRELDGVPNTK